MVEIQPYLQRVAERAASPALQVTLKGFNRTLLFRFTDTQEEWLLRFVDGAAPALSKETLAQPDITVITTTDILAGVMDKKVNPMAAYMQRKIQTKGAMDDLMKLQKLML